MIPIQAIKAINRSLKIDSPGVIRYSESTVKHAGKHTSDVKNVIGNAGLTMEDYINFICRNFNEIRLGNVEKSIILIVRREELHDMAALHLFFDKNESFWLVKTAHIVHTEDIERMKALWKK